MAIGGKKGKGFKPKKEKQFTDESELAQENERLEYRGRMPSSDSDSEQEAKTANPVAALIETSNPNKKVNKPMKLKDLSVGNEEEPEDDQPMSRKEREALAKEEAKERYMKLTMEGKTEQARADLARLAIIRKQREEAARKREEAAKEAQMKKQESLAAGKSIISKSLGKK
jgi:hypothetical protein